VPPTLRKVAVEEALLEIRNATKIYGGGLFGRGEKFLALQDFNLVVPDKPATITAIAGESGSGKTTLANAILGFVQLSSGSIRYRGTDISQLSHSELLDYRHQVQAIFQDPYEVYNPFYRIKHVFDLVNNNLKVSRSKKEMILITEDALRVVGLRGEEVLEKYPHQLSGGQRQRIMVARAYMLNPKLIVADEPVSAVDASLRASILEVMVRLRDKSGISFLYITHDLSTSYQICDDLYVLYQGIVAERGNTVQVIENPKHPYVQLLLNSVPIPDPRAKWKQNIDIPLDETMQTSTSTGCRFYPRCPQRMERCLVESPPLYSINGVHQEVACFLYAG
jgi:peptide/nickel transport system ATP-binding protein